MKERIESIRKKEQQPENAKKPKVRVKIKHRTWEIEAEKTRK